MLVRIFTVALFEKKILQFFFTDLPFHMHTLDEHQTVVCNICERIHAYMNIYACKHNNTSTFYIVRQVKF
jgi:hypothetical protein